MLRQRLHMLVFIYVISFCTKFHFHMRGGLFTFSMLTSNSFQKVIKEINKSFIKKKHLAVRRLNYVYNIQVIIKMDLKNHNNRNVQSNKNISHRITLC